MCGIFGYVLKEPLNLTYTLEILRKLEVYTYPGRTSPIGGHGAGVAYLTPEGNVFLGKVGKTDGSPVSDLISSLNPKDSGAKVVLGHVRRASPQFNETVKYGECTQPYKAECLGGTTVISIHNGFLRNYTVLKDGLSRRHQYESAKVEFIDSEVFPHVYEELVEAEGAEKALERLFYAVEGTATVALLSLREKERALSLLHKNSTVGFNLWTNSEREVLFCSRWEPVEEFLGELLKRGGFKKKVFIDYREPAGAYFCLKPPFL